MLRVGLTGGIATGKSLVSGYFKGLGAHIIDYDLLAREVVALELPAWKDIVNYFGKDVLQMDGSLDRNKLGRIVFNDEAKRLKLNSFTHPRVIEEAKKQEEAVGQAEPDAVIVHDVPLLFEVGIDKMVDKTVVVCITEENQVKRLMARNKMSRGDALSRIRAQMPVAEKVKRADYVIDNNGSMENTKKQVVELYGKFAALARKKR